MIKSTLPAILGLVGLCLPLAAQTPADVISRAELERTGQSEIAPALALQNANIFRGVDGSVLIRGLPVLTLLDGRRLPGSTELGAMGMNTLDFLPVALLSAVEVQKTGGSPRYGTDAPGGIVNLRLNRIQTSGEVGMRYGRSEGKYGREDFSTYFIGGLGNEKTQITVGASYYESNGRVPASFR